jgi:hypothetical protein
MPHGEVARTVARVVTRPDRLREIARELEQEAGHLRRQAEEIEARAEIETRQRRRKLLIRDAAMRVARGERTVDEEAAYLARVLDNADAAGMALVITAECQRSRRVLKAWRDRELMARARTGWTNAQLGEYFDLHKNSVSRIVQAQLRRSR